MLWRHRKAASAVLAIIAGSIFSLANYALADPECGDLNWVEGVGAQDTNGDGLATLAEGNVDLNGDGKFTCFEAEHFGMSCFICWGNCASEEEVLETLPENLCVQSCLTGTNHCMHVSGNTCQRTATGCK